ncbi:MAG: inositol monophosphatase family protein [Anaerolineae bacterium]
MGVVVEDVMLHLAHNTAIVAALAGGRAAMIARSGSLDRQLKAPRDMVTAGDYAAQAAVFAEIGATFPEHNILSEEGSVSGNDSPYCWIVDPIDGTTNYYRGLPFFSVSVAMAAGEELLVGAVYDPSRDEMFSAMRGQGAFLNGQPIHTTATAGLGECAFSLGMSYDALATYRMLKVGQKVVPLCACNRTLGSAALVLSYIACGRLDAYLHPLLYPWDAAAGALILREAGGIMTDLWGNDWDFNTKESLAASPSVHGELLRVVREALDLE